MDSLKPFLIVAAVLTAIFFLSSKDSITPMGGGGDTQSDVVSAFLAPFGLADSDPLPADPMSLRKADFYGWNVWSPGLVLPDATVAFVHDAIADPPKYRKRVRENLPRPASYTVVAPPADCKPRQVAAGEVVVNVSIGGAGGTSKGNLAELNVFSKEQFAKDARDWLEDSLRKMKPDNAADLAPQHPMQVLDLVVTDTSGPLYLVLQHRYGGYDNGVLWNVIPAPGVEIAHITMIGPRTAVNPPPGDYDIDYLTTGKTGCAPPVARLPQPFWNMYHITMGRNDLQEYETEARTRFAAYDAWFRATFGQGAEDGVVGVNSMNHLLYGPLPETPLPYRPIEGSTVAVGEEDFIFTEPAGARTEFVVALQLDRLALAAGGDLNNLFPAPMTREVEE